MKTTRDSEGPDRPVVGRYRPGTGGSPRGAGARTPAARRPPRIRDTPIPELGRLKSFPLPAQSQFPSAGVNPRASLIVEDSVHALAHTVPIAGHEPSPSERRPIMLRRALSLALVTCLTLSIEIGVLSLAIYLG